MGRKHEIVKTRTLFNFQYRGRKIKVFAIGNTVYAEERFGGKKHFHNYEYILSAFKDLQALKRAIKNTIDNEENSAYLDMREAKAYERMRERGIG